MSRNRLYTIIMMACSAGMVWLFLQYSIKEPGQAHEANACLIKQATTIPCPSCGTTRSIFALVEGKVGEAFHLNPFGILVLLVMIVSPLWIVFDIIFRKESFARYYHIVENQVKNKWFAIPAITAVLANWIWNICKGL